VIHRSITRTRSENAGAKALSGFPSKELLDDLGVLSEHVVEVICVVKVYNHAQ